MAVYEEPTISRETIFSGKIISLYVDRVKLPNGETGTREIVKHSGAAAVMPISDDQRLVVVEQFRKPLEKMTIEIPAGKLDIGEEPLQCAIRELREETGYEAKYWTPLVSFFTSPGFADEEIHLYIAKGLTMGTAQPDEGEYVHTKTITLEEALELIKQGHICDAKTILAIYAWQLMEK